MSHPPPETVTVHTSWRGLAAAIASPVLLLAFGAMVLIAGGVGPAAVLLLGLGLVLAGIALVDYPRRAVFGPTGIERVCWIRTQHLPWGELVAIERTPPGAAAALRRRGTDAPATGGLVARGTGKRRYLLTDRIEGQREFDAIARLLRETGVATNLRAPRPSLEAPPTDLYRRRRSRAEQDDR